MLASSLLMTNVELQKREPSSEHRLLDSSATNAGLLKQIDDADEEPDSDQAHRCGMASHVSRP